MIKSEKIKFETKSKFYNYLNMKLTGIVCEEEDWLANLANSAALIWALTDDINWAGFYLYKNDELVLGPFQGNPACTHIQLSKGVCGKAASELKTQLVKNVHDFAGHIACDSASNSEIVVPIVQNERLIGVLDIDSPILGRFDEEDQIYLERLVSVLIKYIKFPPKFI